MNDNPFGTDITSDDILEDLAFFDDWEDRYRYIIDLGKKLPAMPEEQKTADNFVHGCQSQVWISAHYNADNNTLQFLVDSDAHIVRGLSAVVLIAIQQRPAAEIAALDIEAIFDELGLLSHLSVTRGNGLRAMVARIKEVAAQS